MYSLPNAQKYNILKGPSNLRISKEGTIHWIPINTQIGPNQLEIEVRELETSYTYILEIFVNAPPIISYRPDEIEYINYNDNFDFQLQSFDQNTNQPLYWNLNVGPKGMLINQANIIWQASTLDVQKYIVELSLERLVRHPVDLAQRNRNTLHG